MYLFLFLRGNTHLYCDYYAQALLKGFTILQIGKLKQEILSNLYVICSRSHSKQQIKDFHLGSLPSELMSSVTKLPIPSKCYHF